MVNILMKLAKMAAPALLKKIFLKESLWRHSSCPWRHWQNFITWFTLKCNFGHVTKVWQLQHFCERSYYNLIKDLTSRSIWPEKPLFLKGRLGSSSIIWSVAQSKHTWWAWTLWTSTMRENWWFWDEVKRD